MTISIVLTNSSGLRKATESFETRNHTENNETNKNKNKCYAIEHIWLILLNKYNKINLLLPCIQHSRSQKESIQVEDHFWPPHNVPFNVLIILI